MVGLDVKSVLITMLLGLCFAVQFRSPRRYLAHATGLCLLAFVAQTLISSVIPTPYATFLAAFIVAVASHTLARITGKPAQAFLIPGVILLVQGISVYQGFASSLSMNLSAMGASLMHAVLETCAISFGLLVANWVFPARRAL